MQKKIIKLLIVSIIIFIIGVFFISLNKSSLYDTKGLEGQIITDIKLEHFNEKKIITNIDLKKNKFTLINFWASWCAPCRLEHPFLLKLSTEKKLKIIGVNFKDKKNNALNFLNQFGNPYDELVKDELGKHSVEHHKSMTKIINKLKIDKVHIYGKDIKKTYQGLENNKKGLVLSNILQINYLINKILSNKDYLMVKGSNSTGLYKQSQLLKLNRSNAL